LGRVPVPKPGFLDTREYIGYIEGERRWRGPNGMLYTWDGLHGEIEAYNKRGHHLAALDAVTGAVIKNARKGKRIRV
jgi:hypothetical protein